jgi:hypothetical protein
MYIHREVICYENKAIDWMALFEVEEEEAKS